ncbi:hypothetical protein [Halocynthiibacter namhaensis]|uniref:hypothetical protein n=1 Tax=Halocynthiibacter namhaensis TaxID=1290553 RepID=UPI000579340E|nr:hypothetical protein [Halocynthiibacter namhaensis]
MSNNPTASLARTRQVLLSGAFTDLAALVTETEQLVNNLGAANPSPSLLLEIKQLAQQNMPMLVAARKGFADAKERQRQIIEVASGLKTYNQSGKFRATPRPGLLEQKS